MNACAACGRPVREFGGRLVCGCGAVSMPREQFVDLLGGDVEILDDTPTERRCPRCTEKMRSCRVTVAGIDLDHDVLHCAYDGNIWLPVGLLEHILTATEREIHREVPARRGTHAGPGLWDAEREEARLRMVETWRTWSRHVVVALGMLLGLVVIASAGWWCIGVFVACGLIAALIVSPPRLFEPAPVIAIGLSPRPTSLVRTAPLRRRLR